MKQDLQINRRPPSSCDAPLLARGGVLPPRDLRGLPRGGVWVFRVPSCPAPPWKQTRPPLDNGLSFGLSMNNFFGLILLILFSFLFLDGSVFDWKLEG
jgi:hypothetical protein